ncbi:hypothetical protein IG197_22125 [Aminobacter sp. SR38]|jgi:hypothetical protein|uniref:hypothetical protein n=1 Tax=Aminobacter TaxID=31988 RepID=UPI00177D5606|nr:hypothetical protein [Aminobacter sp. SR38]QOF70478.1 hypothetical protein IG197_22125 [Aminobacter sp. SR38]
MTAILILAHPGHELRIFHWMEQARPIVHILTDGSGGNQSSRTDHSRETLLAAGATTGSVFGQMPDKEWYAAILAGNAAPFIEASKAMLDSVAVAAAVTVVADAVDGYNPVHDLTGAIGAAVAARLRAAGAAVTHLVSAAVPGVAGARHLELPLDAAARERKMAAVHAYAPLAEEARRIAEEAPEAFGREVLMRQDFDWPDDFEPHWEKFAKERVASGRYSNPITYRDHVRPIAQAILGL